MICLIYLSSFVLSNVYHSWYRHPCTLREKEFERISATFTENISLRFDESIFWIDLNTDENGWLLFSYLEASLKFLFGNINFY